MWLSCVVLLRSIWQPQLQNHMYNWYKSREQQLQILIVKQRQRRSICSVVSYCRFLCYTLHFCRYCKFTTVISFRYCKIWNQQTWSEIEQTRQGPLAYKLNFGKNADTGVCLCTAAAALTCGKPEFPISLKTAIEITLQQVFYMFSKIRTFILSFKKTRFDEYALHKVSSQEKPSVWPVNWIVCYHYWIGWLVYIVRELGSTPLHPQD